MGEVASWQLRDTYENVVGKKPPRDWAWERTARELFARVRSAALRPGRQAVRGRPRPRAPRAILRPCARASTSCWPTIPTSSRTRELAAGYVAFAQAAQDKSRAEAHRGAAPRRASGPDAQGRHQPAPDARSRSARGKRHRRLPRCSSAPSRTTRKTRAPRAALARFERGEPKRSEKARFIAAGSILGAGRRRHRLHPAATRKAEPRARARLPTPEPGRTRTDGPNPHRRTGSPDRNPAASLDCSDAQLYAPHPPWQPGDARALRAHLPRR